MRNLFILLAFWMGNPTRYLRAWRRKHTRPSLVRYRGVQVPLPDPCPEGRRRSFYKERHERRFALYAEVLLKPEDVVLELGAGLGFISTRCALLIGSDRVTTMEANPLILPHIRHVYEANGVSPDLIHAAVDVEDGEACFVSRENIVSSSMQVDRDDSRTTTVPAAGLGRILAEVKPTFVFCDVEGAEGRLIEAVDLDGVFTLALELHRGVIGDDGVAQIHQRLLDQGFVRSRLLSSRMKWLYRRNAPKKMSP